MSRSRKKLAVWKQKNDRWYKRYSNKVIRKTDIDSGGMFRRVVNSWNICDWKTNEHRAPWRGCEMTDEEIEKAKRK